MKSLLACVAVLALNTTCRSQSASTERLALATAIPQGWIAIPPYDPASAAASCANQSSAQWHVEIAGDGATLLVRPESTWADRPEILSVPDGRLIGIDRGEFGGGAWWVSDSRTDSTLLTRANLHDFIQLESGRIIGLVGLAHMGIDTGAVVTFERGTRGWRAVHLLDL